MTEVLRTNARRLPLKIGDIDCKAGVREEGGRLEVAFIGTLNGAYPHLGEIDGRAVRLVKPKASLTTGITVAEGEYVV